MDFTASGSSLFAFSPFLWAIVQISQMERAILFLRCLQMTPALAIKEDASAEDKVRDQFVVAIAEMSLGVTWAPPEDGRRGAAVQCAAIAASKVAVAAIGAFSCGNQAANLCSVPFVQLTALKFYARRMFTEPYWVNSSSTLHITSQELTSRRPVMMMMMMMMRLAAACFAHKTGLNVIREVSVGWGSWDLHDLLDCLNCRCTQRVIYVLTRSVVIN